MPSDEPKKKRATKRATSDAPLGKGREGVGVDLICLGLVLGHLLSHVDNAHGRDIGLVQAEELAREALV